MSKRFKLKHSRKRKKLNLIAKAKSFKQDQQQKYEAVKKYFASETTADKQQFVEKEQVFLIELLKLLAYLGVILVLYFFLSR